MPTQAREAQAPEKVHIELGDRSYEICIGSDLLHRADWLTDLPAASQVMIVTNQTVEPLYAAKLEHKLRTRYARVHTVALPDGEAYKDWASLNLIFDSLLKHACDRKTLLFALGGGVVGDMTGFAASCYMRGVPFVQLPTTLLAQVDSSVGGKTAINHPLGKNMIGAFHQPLKVVCDIGVLASLPGRELSAGLAEVIKYGPIADLSFLAWLESHLDDLLCCDQDALAYAVRRSCEIKAAVVAQDERDNGVRAILNFGHTFGHAIEHCMGYGTWLHGEAVGCGMVMAATLSQRLGLVPQDFVERLAHLIARARLPVQAPAMDPLRYLHAMRVDKKAQDGKLQFVLIDRPGSAIVREVHDDLVLEVLRACSAS